MLVHRDYDDNQDWYATAGVGLLPESLVVTGNLKKTGERLFMSLRKRFFAGRTTQLQSSSRRRRPTCPTPGKSIVLSGEVHYKIKGLPSTYDRMFVALVELRSGRYAAFYSVRPNDIPNSALTALRRLTRHAVGALRRLRSSDADASGAADRRRRDRRGHAEQQRGPVHLRRHRGAGTDGVAVELVVVRLVDGEGDPPPLQAGELFVGPAATGQHPAINRTQSRSERGEATRTSRRPSSARASGIIGMLPLSRPTLPTSTTCARRRSGG